MRIKVISIENLQNCQKSGENTFEGKVGNYLGVPVLMFLVKFIVYYLGLDFSVRRK